MFNLSDDRKLGLAAIGSGLSQLAMGQPVNIMGSPAAQMLQQRQQQTALTESGILNRFTPEQRAILAQMPPAAAMQVIAGEAFRPPAAPMKGTEINGRLVNPVTGEVIADFSDDPEQPDMVRVISGEEAAAMGLDPAKAYEVTNDAAGNLVNVSGIGGGDTNIEVSTGDNLTPGQTALDKAYADRYLEWVTGRGADASNQAAQIASVAEALENGAEWTGPTIGIQGDFIRALTNPEAQDAKDRVEGVVQRSLKDTLGAQFTEKEGERLIQRAYNINLSPAQNAARLRALYQTIQARVDAENQMAQYFEEHGSLKGMSRVYVPTADDMIAAMESAAPEPATQAETGDIPPPPSGYSAEEWQEIWNLMPEADKALFQ